MIGIEFTPCAILLHLKMYWKRLFSWTNSYVKEAFSVWHAIGQVIGFAYSQ